MALIGSLLVMLVATIFPCACYLRIHHGRLTKFQPLFIPRVKRCTTHHYICQNIQYIQQMMKTAVGGPVPLFGAKPCNFNVMPPAEFNGNITGRSMSSLQDMGQQIITIFPGNSEKDNSVLQNDKESSPQIIVTPKGYVVTDSTTNVCHGRKVSIGEKKIHIEEVFELDAPIWGATDGNDTFAAYALGGYLVWYESWMRYL